MGWGWDIQLILLQWCVVLVPSGFISSRGSFIQLIGEPGEILFCAGEPCLEEPWPWNEQCALLEKCGLRADQSCPLGSSA